MTNKVTTGDERCTLKIAHDAAGPMLGNLSGQLPYSFQNEDRRMRVTGAKAAGYAVSSRCNAAPARRSNASDGQDA